MGSARSHPTLTNPPSASSSQHAPAVLVTTPTTNVLADGPTTATPPISISSNSSRSTSRTMTAALTPRSNSTPRHPPPHSPSSCEACTLDRPYIPRIRSPAHVVLAVRLLLADPSRRSALFTNWIHVPVGITSLLLLTWLIKQAMDRAPFRFPSPVLAMLLLFVLLLLLDYLSTTAPIRRIAPRHRKADQAEKKMLLQPALGLLEAPCDFCLRYMSVMFTPSFILIPAREIIGGREIGLITGWFAASQVAALIVPVLLHRALRWGVAAVKRRCGASRLKRQVKVQRAEEQRRASVATLVAVMSSINPPVHDVDVDSEKAAAAVGGREGSGTMHGGAMLGSVATGLSGMTAIATVPLTLDTRSAASREASREASNRTQDARRQLEHVQLETARQQGDPFALSHSPVREHHRHYPLRSPSLSSRPGSPALQHSHPLHSTQAGYFARGRRVERPEVARSRSLARSWVADSPKTRDVSLPPSRTPRPRSGNDAAKSKGRIGAVVGPGSALLHLASQRRPQSASAASARFDPEGKGDVSPTFDEYILRARRDLLERRRSSAVEEGVDPRAEVEETLVMPTLVPTTPTRTSDEVRHEAKSLDDDIEAQPRSSGLASSDEKPSPSTKDLDSPPAAGEQIQVPEMDAVDRLVERLWLSLPWLFCLLLLITGLPVFYLLDISLPLFLAVNIVTFLASITLVPAPIRRYAHPILTTSVATVLLLWGLGAARGWRLKRTLSSYSVDAKYTVLWSLGGYQGPVIGAGDVLFSTLDAGIVSLAIPMYRYRWDLWAYLGEMLSVLLPCSLLSLFVWPTVAGAVGVAPERALAFASRFMSTPLAIELSLTIGADESLTVVLVVITGILISIFKDPFFRLLRLNPDIDGPTDKENDETGGNQDYLTIGIAMGSTAGAIGASSLISKPRSMAIASLSFVLFGAILLIFAAIPPIVDTLRGLAGAPLEFTPSS